MPPPRPRAIITAGTRTRASRSWINARAPRLIGRRPARAPRALPAATSRSQSVRIRPMDSSLPKNEARSSRARTTCASSEVRPRMKAVAANTGGIMDHRLPRRLSSVGIRLCGSAVAGVLGRGINRHRQDVLRPWECPWLEHGTAASRPGSLLRTTTRSPRQGRRRARPVAAKPPPHAPLRTLATSNLKADESGPDTPASPEASYSAPPGRLRLVHMPKSRCSASPRDPGFCGRRIGTCR